MTEEQREIKRKRSIDWYYANKQRRLDSNKKWLSYRPRYFSKLRSKETPEQRERRLESLRDYYRRNAEKLKANNTQYRREHPEVAYAASHNNRAKRNGAVGKHSASSWASRFAFYGWACAYCHSSLPSHGYHKDHVIPIVAKGTNWPSNLVPACKKCNHKKHTRRWIPRQPKPKGSLPE